MNERIVPTTSNSISFSTSVPPCSPNEVAISPGDCVKGGMEEWLEDETVAGFRVWQLAGIVLSILLTIMIALCCCIRFRVPRTKQEIEADYIRKRITRSFRKELAKINNEEMDEMDLDQALDRVRAKFDAETELQKRQRDQKFDEQPRGFRARFNSILHGVHLRLARNEPRELNGVI
ncbi:transmembrane inner ear expressed protein [Athalia rosae]|uniref:transmembrane inner ear expressed protein n=1 Tax=Athalia rosae TaxID=37344 RepID=UPI000625A8D3|nr:transmembrane inner ear expressed protein [Athalia rosae]